jgi:thiosulfate/3-mercaptopyruvate sulfurtransferase
MVDTSPLISAVALAARLDDPRVRAVDVRWVLREPGAGRRAYEAGHLPGAIFLDLDGALALPPGPGLPGRHPLPSPTDFAATLARVGIGSDDFVVAYDDVGGWVAARLWWMLDDLGHRGGEAVLDGGIQAWRAAGLPVTAEAPQVGPAEAPPALAERWSRVIGRDELKGRLGDVLLLDARGGPRYRGEVEPIDPYPGHIPTAVNAPTDGNLVEPSGRFLSPAELRVRYAALRVTGSAAEAASEEGDVVTSCGSGTSACHLSLAMRVAGLPDPLLYVGSYSDWSRAGEPVALGPDPGVPARSSGRGTDMARGGPAGPGAVGGGPT